MMLFIIYLLLLKDFPVESK